MSEDEEVSEDFSEDFSEEVSSVGRAVRHTTCSSFASFGVKSLLCVS